MDFDLSDEQRQLADSLERLLAQHYGLEQRKARLSAGPDAPGGVWPMIAELGVLSLPISEAAGGFGGGAVDLLRPMALLGHALVVEPVLAHLTAARLLDAVLHPAESTRDPAWRERLQSAADGSLRLCWARATDPTAHDLTAIAEGDGWRIDGRLDGIVGAQTQTWLLLTAIADGHRQLFLLPPATTGVDLVVERGLDGQAVGRLECSALRLPAAARLGTGNDPAAIEAAQDAAADFESALLCAEAVGLIESACAATLDYLKTRKQFGVTIGSFQALQHRIVDLHVELEQVRSMAALAASKVDAARTGQIDAAERAHAVAAARVLIGKAADRVAQEAVQLHGGMGMADELKVSHTFRRLTVLARQSGSVSDFLDRFIATGR